MRILQYLVLALVRCFCTIHRIFYYPMYIIFYLTKVTAIGMLIPMVGMFLVFRDYGDTEIIGSYFFLIMYIVLTLIAYYLPIIATKMQDHVDAISLWTQQKQRDLFR